MYADGAGLYLRVSEGGNKSWIFRFKQKRADGKFVARDMGLVGYPEVSLAEARDLAKEAREHHQAGRDPIQQRKDDKARAIAQQRAAEAQGITFRQFANQWIENNKAAWKNARHQAQWVKTFEDYVYPVIGDKAVSAVDTDDVLKVLEPIWNTKTVTASRVRGRMEKVLAAAKALKLAPTIQRCGAATSTPCCSRNRNFTRSSISRPCPTRTCRRSWRACGPWSSPSSPPRAPKRRERRGSMSSISTPRCGRSLPSA